MSQLRGSPLARAGNSGDVSSCGPRAGNPGVLRAVALRAIGNADDGGELQLGQQAPPLVLRDTRLVRTDIDVLEKPPALQQAEGHRADQPRTCRLRQHECAGRAQQGNLIQLQRPAQILRGMQNIRCNDQVERMRIGIPCSSGSRSISSARYCTNGYFENLCCALRGEAGRDVGEHVFGAMVRKDRQDRGTGRPASSAANLQDSQRLSLRQALNDLAERFLHQQIIEAKRREILVQLRRGVASDPSGKMMLKGSRGGL